MSFNIWLGLYIILAIAIIAGGSMKLKDMGMMGGAFVFFVGSLAIFLLFGLRWFRQQGILSGADVQWPPSINSCPDGLTAYKRTVGGVKKDVCIDTIGMSRNAGISVFPVGGGPEPTDDKYYFDLSTTSSESAAKAQELCQRANLMGLSWEGISNGESCTTKTGAKRASGGAGGSSAGCSA